MNAQFEPAPIRKTIAGVIQSDNETPFYLPELEHPGEILKEDLEAMGWTQKDLAEVMGRPEQAISEIVKGTKQITPETAIELGTAMGQSPDYWLRLETSYRLALARGRQSSDTIATRARIYSMLPVREIARRGWLPEAGSLEEQVCAFFAIDSIWDEPRITASLRTASHRGPMVGAVAAWLRRVEVLAAAQSAASFDSGALHAALPDIAAMSEVPSRVSEVPGRLAALGVRFLVVPHLTKSFLDGGTVWIEGGPVVALTCRYNRVDNFWFTLMHELAHVVLGHTDTFAENLEDINDDPREVAANELASDVLLDPAAYSEVISSGDPDALVSAAVAVAARVHRHPAIVIGRLQHDNKIGYQRGRGYLEKVRHHLAAVSDPVPA
jgi:HTH-type transcriptional regulator/antitoxin HigA